MARIVLLKQASETTGISYTELYYGARSGKYPFFRLGGERGRWATDLDLLEARIKELALQNLRQPEQQDAVYGVLRRVR